jgi:uncharacterized protein YfaS (alpha-2-macroglobulin family)
MREVAEVRGQYEKMRDQHGFRLLDYTVDSDGASPRACFQFSEDLAKRVDFAPFVALAGTDKPALTSEGRQLCVDGLKHGERYNINLRTGLPSTVKETLPKSAEFNIYVRDRKPFVRFTGRAYVLPRTGQRGIPLVSVNTPAVNVNVFRIGDRNLINRSRRPRCGWWRATTRSSPPARPMTPATCCSKRGWRAARAGCRRRC